MPTSVRYCESVGKELLPDIDTCCSLEEAASEVDESKVRAKPVVGGCEKEGREEGKNGKREQREKVSSGCKLIHKPPPLSASLSLSSFFFATHPLRSLVHFLQARKAIRATYKKSNEKINKTSEGDRRKRSEDRGTRRRQRMRPRKRARERQCGVLSHTFLSALLFRVHSLQS